MHMDKKNYGIWTKERCSEHSFQVARFRTGYLQQRDRGSAPWDRNTRLSFVIEYLRPVTHQILGAVLRWRDRHIAIRTLEALNDHYLLDVGIERSDIHSIVNKGRNRSEHP